MPNSVSDEPCISSSSPKDQIMGTTTTEACKVKKFLEYIQKLKSNPQYRNYQIIVGMEACSGSNYWAVTLESQFNIPTFIFPAIDCKFINRALKDDRNDAKAVLDLLRNYLIDPRNSLSKPSIIRDEESQNEMTIMKTLFDCRDESEEHKRQLVDILRERNPLAGYTYSMPVDKVCEIAQRYANKRANDGLPASVSIRISIQHHISAIALCQSTILNIQSSFIRVYEETHPSCKKLEKVCGSSFIVAVFLCILLQGDFKRFKNPRALCSYLGFTPKHTGTGGKTHITSMSSKGNNYIKQLIFECAHSRILAINRIRKEQNKSIIDTTDKRNIIKEANKFVKELWQAVNTTSDITTHSDANKYADQSGTSSNVALQPNDLSSDTKDTTASEVKKEEQSSHKDKGSNQKVVFNKYEQILKKKQYRFNHKMNKVKTHLEQLLQNPIIFEILSLAKHDTLSSLIKDLDLKTPTKLEEQQEKLSTIELISRLRRVQDPFNEQDQE